MIQFHTKENYKINQKKKNMPVILINFHPQGLYACTFLYHHVSFWFKNN